MQNLETIKTLRNAAQQIKDLFLEKIPRWDSDKSHYDKVRVGFVQGDSDGWYRDQEITIFFQAWCGTYGNSSTYKQFDIDSKIFHKHFMAYMNRHKEEIMMKIADSIEKEAATLYDKAQDELLREMDKLKELTVS